MIFILLLVPVLGIGIFAWLIWYGKKKENEMYDAPKTSDTKQNDSQKTLSVREFFPIKTIGNGYIETDRNLIRITEIGSANLFAKSEEELNGLFRSFREFVLSLEAPIQMVIQSRQADISDYLEFYEPHVERLGDELGYDSDLALYARHVADFLKETYQEKRPVRRNFIVHSIESTGDFEFDISELDRHVEGDIHGIEGCDLTVYLLGEVSLHELIQTFVAKNYATTMKVRDAFRNDDFEPYVSSERKSVKEGKNFVSQKRIG